MAQYLLFRLPYNTTHIARSRFGINSAFAQPFSKILPPLLHLAFWHMQLTAIEPTAFHRQMAMIVVGVCMKGKNIFMVMPESISSKVPHSIAQQVRVVLARH